MSLLALSGATIFRNPNDNPIRDGIVLVDGGKIAAVGARGGVSVPEAAKNIDCSGLTLVAGFWNSHVHFFERKWAAAASMPREELERQLRETFARYGFTNVFDTGSFWENTRAIRDRIESGEVAGPHIRSTGAGIVPPGALPSETVVQMMGLVAIPAPEVASAAEAAAAARALLEAGTDGIKLFASSPRSGPMAQKVMRAAGDEAHARGKPSFVHPNNAEDVRNALAAGIEIIAHTTPNSAWDDEILSAVEDRTPGLTPTLYLWKFFARHDRASVQDRAVESCLKQVRDWRDAGGTVLFGTDLGAVDPDPAPEYALMFAAGMRFEQILDSLTTAPAKQFGDADRLGQIAPGFHADLVALNGDPTQDIGALADVRLTLRSGKLVCNG